MAKKKTGKNAFTEEFRREAVRLVEANPDQLSEIAQDLGVNRQSLQNWRRRAKANADGSIIRPAHVLSLEEENRRLRQENARLLEEREILKKATAFFAKDAR